MTTAVAASPLPPSSIEREVSPRPYPALAPSSSSGRVLSVSIASQSNRSAPPPPPPPPPSGAGSNHDLSPKGGADGKSSPRPYVLFAFLADLSLSSPALSVRVLPADTVGIVVEMEMAGPNADPSRSSGCPMDPRQTSSSRKNPWPRPSCRPHAIDRESSTSPKGPWPISP